MKGINQKQGTQEWLIEGSWGWMAQIKNQAPQHLAAEFEGWKSNLQTPAKSGLEIVVGVTRIFEGRGFLILSHFSFEEILLLFEIDRFGKPREWVFNIAARERLEVAIDEAAIRNVVDVLLKLCDREADRVDGQAIANELFLKANPFSHGLAEIFLELGSHDLRVLHDKGVEEIEEDVDMIGLVAQGIAEHLANPREFILTVKAQYHAEEPIKLGALHDLAKHEDVLSESLLVFENGEVDIAAKRTRV